MLETSNTARLDPLATGAAINEARRRRGWTQAELVLEVRKQLGKKFAFTPQTLDNIEKGKVRYPGDHTQFAIATVLKLDVAALWPAPVRGRS
ncbi:MAG: helix-turn-helix transcriptional regulator [Patulibacter minatonensis]